MTSFFFFCLIQIIAREGIRVAAGGHIGYGALGSSVVRAPPLNPHFYGPVGTQVAHLPVSLNTIHTGLSSSKKINRFFLQNHTQEVAPSRSLFPPKAPSIYASGESYLPPHRPSDLKGHYTSNTHATGYDDGLNVGINPAPTNVYHATDPGPVGYANLQSSTAPTACEVTPQLYKPTHTYVSFPNTYSSTRPDPVTSH